MGLSQRQPLPHQQVWLLHLRRRRGSLRGVSGVKGSASVGVLVVVLVRTRSPLMTKWMEGRLSRSRRQILGW